MHDSKLWSAMVARFVTLQHAFHPETVDAIIASTTDKPLNEEANKWDIAWTEATVVVVDEDSSAFPQSTGNEGNVSGETEVNASEIDHTTQSSSEPRVKFEAPFYHGYLIDSTIGLCFTTFAVGATLLFELNGLMVYFAAVALDRTGRLCGIRPLFSLLVVVLLGVDALLLALSVMVTELLAWVARLLTTLSAGCRQGAEWHQYIRKLCTLVLWVVRDFHQDWALPRIFPLFRLQNKKMEGSNQVPANAMTKEEEEARKRSGQPIPELVVWQ